MLETIRIKIMVCSLLLFQLFQLSFLWLGSAQWPVF